MSNTDRGLPTLPSVLKQRSPNVQRPIERPGIVIKGQKAGSNRSPRKKVVSALTGYFNSVGRSDAKLKIEAARAKKERDLTRHLYEAALNGDVVQIRTILENTGTSIDVRFNGGEAGIEEDQLTMLHCACKRDNAGLVHALLEMGANADAQGSAGSTPLHVACAHGHPMCTRLLVNASAGVDRLNASGEAALTFALGAGDYDSAQALLAAGASLDVPVRDANSEVGTPLHAAASHGWLDCIETLLANPKVRSKLDAPNEAGRTALMVACQAGSVEATRKLLTSYACIAARDHSGKSALDYARERFKHFPLGSAEHEIYLQVLAAPR